MTTGRVLLPPPAALVATCSSRYYVTTMTQRAIKQVGSRRFLDGTTCSSNFKTMASRNSNGPTPS